LKNEKEVTFEKTGSVQVEVIDTGTGTSQEQLARLFRDGIQFNVNDLQAGNGSGLGLYISKGLAEQHGGTLDVSSKGLGFGTTFTLTLPLYYVPNSAEQVMAMEEGHNEESAAALSPVVAPPLRMLVVDDVSTNRKLLARLCTKHVHSVTQAADGQEALDQVALAMERGGTLFDTILMDYEMPVMNGPTATREIRALGCDAFIVGITGNLFAEDVNFFKSCGANAVLPKPFDFEELA
jgi:CheY-like chemotaxis protein